MTMFAVKMVPETRVPDKWDKALKPWGWDQKRCQGAQLRFEMNAYQLGRFLEFLPDIGVKMNNMVVTPVKR